MIDYLVRFIDMPVTIKGLTVVENDFANIYINARLSYEQQQEAIKHELTHVKRNDFQKSEASLEMVENI